MIPRRGDFPVIVIAGQWNKPFWRLLLSGYAQSGLLSQIYKLDPVQRAFKPVSDVVTKYNIGLE